MYSLPYFTEKDGAKVIAFMKKNSFAIITGPGEEYPAATQIPLEVIADNDGKIILSGHLMKNTDHHRAFVKNDKVLVIFNGPHCYVSASWYNNPQSASTWNYMTVHAKGTISFSDDIGTYEAIKAITNKYDDAQSAAAFNNMSQAYIGKMLKAIVGFTIEVKTVENIFKLSQNKTSEEQLNIIDKLKKRGDENSILIAAEMKKLISTTQA
ncbi:FMN-binding negative transcriptional regulator [Ferruginibacter paludis]|uniref:FMN-binding negative transcriptional regulator n=1 Tax=Ferruginibacter paludis TaxID=1310417 RepID=UPI0025B3E6EA|nr:FMN-binding negative transcriptional regulator [Ferruginibacter paludis]MDN3658821.1 FMN-binding negative transcriptional regulator [Ferruginibacter paludis]